MEKEETRAEEALKSGWKKEMKKKEERRVKSLRNGGVGHWRKRPSTT